jgi:hypothetical protein
MAIDLSTLESHADPQVRALVRELRAARDVVKETALLDSLLRAGQSDGPIWGLTLIEIRRNLFAYHVEVEAIRKEMQCPI